jgi:hypothetical protein
VIWLGLLGTRRTARPASAIVAKETARDYLEPYRRRFPAGVEDRTETGRSVAGALPHERGDLDSGVRSLEHPECLREAGEINIIEAARVLHSLSVSPRSKVVHFPSGVTVGARRLTGPSSRFPAPTGGVQIC